MAQVVCTTEGRNSENPQQMADAKKLTLPTRPLLKEPSGTFRIRVWLGHLGKAPFGRFA